MSIHVNVELEAAELLFRTVLATSQLNVYGAMAHRRNNQCGQATDHSAGEQPQDVPPDLASDLTRHKNWDQLAQGDLAQKRDEENANLPADAKLRKVCGEAGFVRTVCV